MWTLIKEQAEEIVDLQNQVQRCYGPSAVQQREINQLEKRHRGMVRSSEDLMHEMDIIKAANSVLVKQLHSFRKEAMETAAFTEKSHRRLYRENFALREAYRSNAQYRHKEAMSVEAYLKWFESTRGDG